MEPIWEGHIAGEFHGYESGRVYSLSDGSRWREDDRTKEYVVREREGEADLKSEHRDDVPRLGGHFGHRSRR